MRLSNPDTKSTALNLRRLNSRITQLSWGPNTIYFHGGEIPGYNSKISYHPANDMTLIVWTNLAVSLDEKLQQTANTLWVNVLDQIYVVSPLQPLPSAATTR